MSQRKNIAISCLACVLVMIVAGGILFWMNAREESVVEPATSYTDLELRISFPGGEQRVNIWQSPEDIYYFFLPSGSENYQISFGNLGDGSSLQLDSILFHSYDSTIDDIKYSNIYEMQLKLSEDDLPLETAQVVFLKSEGLPTLFIDTASGNMQTIHADKEVKEEAAAFLVESDGTREYSGNIEYITARGNSTFNFKSAYQNAVLYVSEDRKIRATEGLDNPEDITGGYLIEHIPKSVNTEFDNGFVTDSGHCYQIISPNPATVEQVEYICNYFNEMEVALSQEDGIHPVTGKHFSEYIDLDSWTSKYLMEEVFHDTDALTSSLFFYKDSDSVDSHIYAGPMWDYDRALGSYGSVNATLDNVYQVGGFGIYVQEMMQHQEVQEQVYDKFLQYIIPYVRNILRADVYRIREHIEASMEMDRIRWPNVRGYYSDYEAGCDYLVWFLEHKTDYLKEVWLEEKGEDYCTVTFLDYYGNVYTEYTVKKGECLTTVPSITTLGAIFGGWYSADKGIVFNSKLPILQDVVYRLDWIGMDILLLNGLGAAEMDLSEVDPDVLRNLADQLEQMQSEAADSDAIE